MEVDGVVAGVVAVVVGVASSAIEGGKMSDFREQFKINEISRKLKSLLNIFKIKESTLPVILNLNNLEMLS